MGGPLRADSVLFVCADGAALSPVCRDFFACECARRGLNVASASAGLDVTAELLGRYDAVLCMTLEQADSLAERFPEQEEKIMCLGARDYKAPRLKSGWPKLMRSLKDEIDALCDELEEE